MSISGLLIYPVPNYLIKIIRIVLKTVRRTTNKIFAVKEQKWVVIEKKRDYLKFIDLVVDSHYSLTKTKCSPSIAVLKNVIWINF